MKFELHLGYIVSDHIKNEKHNVFISRQGDEKIWKNILQLEAFKEIRKAISKV